MKLNLGCGWNKVPGFLNVDRHVQVKPDQCVDLEKFPWPWPDNTFDEVMAVHVLEHLGTTSMQWIGVLKELWRVSLPNARIFCVVPNPRHDFFLDDPTHVRAVTPGGLQLFDQRLNQESIRRGLANSTLGLDHGIDLEMMDVRWILDTEFENRSSLRLGGLSTQDSLRHLNNICAEIHILIKVHKPLRATSGSSE